MNKLAGGGLEYVEVLDYRKLSSIVYSMILLGNNSGRSLSVD